MLDVHPPHSATHTWRDFFIHIATIVVGLLIAVGLEQTVEAIHQHHVREELRQALEEDGKVNREFVRQDLAWAKTEKEWALKQASTIERAGPTGPLFVELEAPGRLYVPNTGVWLSAKANGDARLLLSSEQTWLTDLDRVEADIFVSSSSAAGNLKQALSRLDKDLLGRHSAEGNRIDLTSMSNEQRAEVADAFRAVAAADHTVQSRLILYSTYVDLLLSYPSGELKNSNYAETMNQFLTIERNTQVQNPDSLPSYVGKKQ